MQEFLSELKRRHVHQVAVAYVAISWMLLEVADLVFPRVGLPDSAITFVLIVAALGFPVAMVLGWVFDITDAGIIRTKSIPAHQLARLSTGQLLQIAMFGLMVITIAYLMVERGIKNDVGLVPAVGYSIGVLPFENISGDKNNDYFSDGISEELLNALVNVRELRVASRTSSFYFKGKNLTPLEIGKKLAVRLLLEGSVRKAGNRVRVTAKLIDTNDGFSLWSEVYDGELSDIFALQDDIARQVVAAVTPVLNPGESTKQTQLTSNVDAYNYYLLGRDYLRQPVTDTTLRDADESFRAAISEDTGFVQAYAGLCQTILAQYRLDNETKTFNRAESACNRALTRQQGSIRSWEVHLALGELYRFAGEYEKSKTEIENALNLRNDLPSLHISHGMTLSMMALNSQAEASFKQAINVNPSYWDAHRELANFYFAEQDYDAAITQYHKLLDLEPEFPDALIGLGSAHYMKEETDKAEEIWLRAEESVRGDKKYALAHVYTNLGLSNYYDKKFARAVGFQKKAIAQIPGDHKFHGRLAESYRGLNDEANEQKAYRVAIDLAVESLVINPSDWETIGLLSLYQANVAEPELARKYQAEMLEIAPNNPTALYFASLSSLAIEDYASSLMHLKAAIDLGFSKALVLDDPDLEVLKSRDPQGFERALSSES